MAFETLHLRGGLVLYPSQIQEIDRLLAELVEKLPARLAFLTEVSGQLISFQADMNWRDKDRIDPNALGALIAGDLAASREIARLTGEYEDYQLVLRQGPHSHTLISEVGTSLALLVQVSNQTPLGWARIWILETARKLTGAAAPQTKPSNADLGVAVDDLSNLIGNSLDDAWTEKADVR